MRYFIKTPPRLGPSTAISSVEARDSEVIVMQETCCLGLSPYMKYI